MNYRIVGADGKTYGPVTLEQLRQWLAEGRVEGRTPVHVAGAPAWTTLAALPEFRPDTHAQHPPTIAATPAARVQPGGTNRLAMAGLVCALLSWVCCCLPFNLLGIVLCLIALVQIRSQEQPQEGRLFAIIGLVLGVTNIVFVFVVFLMQIAFGNTSVNWNTSF